MEMPGWAELQPTVKRLHAIKTQQGGGGTKKKKMIIIYHNNLQPKPAKSIYLRRTWRNNWRTQQIYSSHRLPQFSNLRSTPYRLRLRDTRPDDICKY